jgi:hypothetical protein
VSAEAFFRKNRVYYGDLHNHCGISYGHGPIEDAYYNAGLQLDFASVTGHAGWPDIDDEPMPQEVVDYHRNGFAELARNWQRYVEATEAANETGRFATFFGYEIHSFRYGDRTVISPDAPDAPVVPDDPDALRELLMTLAARRERRLLLPHHIGYRTGYRGVDWPSVTDAASPIVEIISMHGLAESEDGPFPYLHTMGPLDGRNTMQAGLAAGHHFGVVGSTDHHSAHPGSFGYGKTGVWAESLSRESIWKALMERRTYAMSGDRIELAFSVNGEPMGGMVRDVGGAREVEVAITGGAPLDRVELLRNNKVVHAEHFPPPDAPAPRPGEPVRGKLVVEFGWGEKGEIVSWDATIRISGGTVLGVEPRFRGRDVVDPLDGGAGPFRLSGITPLGPGRDRVTLSTTTFGNPTAGTSQTQAVCLELEAPPEATLSVVANGREETLRMADVFVSSRTFYTAGFVSPAVRIHRFVPEAAYTAEFTTTDQGSGAPEDWYYVRALLRNGHGAWSSPVWARNV